MRKKSNVVALKFSRPALNARDGNMGRTSRSALPYQGGAALPRSPIIRHARSARDEKPLFAISPWERRRPGGGCHRQPSDQKHMRQSRSNKIKQGGSLDVGLRASGIRPPSSALRPYPGKNILREFSLCLCASVARIPFPKIRVSFVSIRVKTTACKNKNHQTNPFYLLPPHE